MAHLVIIRPETASDIAGIDAVHLAAFRGDEEARIVRALRSAGNLTISLVAELDGRILGHIAFSSVTPGSGLGLGPLAVTPDAQRRGIGSQLMQRGLDVARTLGACFIVLIGEPAYYARFGFVSADEWGLRDEYGAGPAFRALELERDAIPRGVMIRYAPQFGGETMEETT